MANKKVIYYRDWDELPLLMTIEECTILFKRSYDCVVKWAQKGIIPAKKFQNVWLIEKYKLKEMFEKNTIA